MKRVIIPLILVICAVFSGCAEALQDEQQALIDSLLAENNQQLATIENLEAISSQQLETIAQLQGALQNAPGVQHSQTGQTESALAGANLPNGISLQTLQEDLLRHTELIPFEGVVGGTPYYWESSFRLLGKYVYISAEDGHIGGDLFFTYTVAQNNAIEWKLVAKDMGAGFELVNLPNQ